MSPGHAGLQTQMAAQGTAPNSVRHEDAGRRPVFLFIRSDADDSRGLVT